MVTARRYGGHGAAAAGIADRAVDERAVRATAIELAAAQAGRAGETIAAIKARMYASVLAALGAGSAG
jgi:enoyl-CoA hydratase/carnithine racemase